METRLRWSSRVGLVSRLASSYLHCTLCCFMYVKCRNLCCSILLLFCFSSSLLISMLRLISPGAIILSFVLHTALVRSTEVNFTLAAVFPSLVNISRNPATGLSPSLGGQNFSHCCAYAVYQSLDIDNGIVRGLRSPSFIGDNLTAFTEREFSCGATYQGMPPPAFNSAESSLCFLEAYNLQR